MTEGISRSLKWKRIYYELQHDLAGERNLNNTSGYISQILI